MSSSTYWAEIRPDPRLRTLVLAVGLCLALLGLVIIGLLPLSGWLRLLGAVLCGAWSARELLTYWRAYRQQRAYRPSAEGELEYLPGSATQTLRLLPGCLVLPGIAWLRIQSEDGRRWGELIVGKQRENEQWRRFQVIFRHLNAG